MEKLLTTIKSIETEKYVISMLEASNGQYYVAYEYQGRVGRSSKFSDMNTAFSLFDKKLIEFTTKVFYN